MPCQQCNLFVFSVSREQAVSKGHHPSRMGARYIQRISGRALLDGLNKAFTCLGTWRKKRTHLRKVVVDDTTATLYNLWVTPVSFGRAAILTQSNVCDDTAKYERCQKWQRDDEAVEKAVIAFAHTVAHPWTVVIKSFWGGEHSKHGRY